MLLLLLLVQVQVLPAVDAIMVIQDHPDDLQEVRCTLWHGMAWHGMAHIVC
jgi:hypothetical protein